MSWLRRNSLLVLGVAGTVLALILSLLIFLDNRAGFRDAEAFATLFAAGFSMIATVWLVVTVLFQRSELALQREELALQREESRRIADETGRQARLMTAQLGISVKQHLVDEVGAYIRLEIAKFCPIVDKLNDRIAVLASEKFARKLASADLIRIFGHGGIQVKVKNSDQVGFVAYGELTDLLPSEYRFEMLGRWYFEAKEAGLEEWFRLQLGHVIGDIVEGDLKLTNRRIRLLLGVAARMDFQ